MMKFKNDHPYFYRPYEGNPYYWNPYHADPIPSHPYTEERQQTMHGQATWTVGGQETKCGIPWSRNNYMTAAVGEASPFTCGQTVNVKNPQNNTEISVLIVDEVRGYPAERINLHRRAFEALGADLNVGIIQVEMEPMAVTEEGRFGERLERMIQLAYPNEALSNYDPVDMMRTETGQVRETYDFMLDAEGETRMVRGEVVYYPETDRIVSINLQER